MTNHYQGNITINPEGQFIQCEIDFTYQIKDEETDVLPLFLYQHFIIDTIKSNAVASYELSSEISDFCPFIDEAKELKLYFNRPYKKGEIISIRFKYHGNVGIVSKWETNRITKEFVEIGIYTPYYPLTKNLQIATFDFKIKLPEDYQLINGNKQNGIWIKEVTTPNNDCTLIAARKFQKLKTKDLCIYCLKDEHVKTADQILNISQWTLDLFTNLFSKRHTDHQLSIVIIPRVRGGGYCRPQLIVFTENVADKKEVNLRYLAHELAHLWWNKSINSNSWEDWLNESFAEYSALLAIRSHDGIDAFNAYIKDYEEKIKGLPPVHGINRDHKDAHEVLYLKGTYILYQLELLIDYDRMVQFLRTLHQQRINNTNDLFRLITKLEDKEIKEKLENFLLND